MTKYVASVYKGYTYRINNPVESPQNKAKRGKGSQRPAFYVGDYKG